MKISKYLTQRRWSRRDAAEGGAMRARRIDWWGSRGPDVYRSTVGVWMTWIRGRNPFYTGTRGHSAMVESVDWGLMNGSIDWTRWIGWWGSRSDDVITSASNHRLKGRCMEWAPFIGSRPVVASCPNQSKLVPRSPRPSQAYSSHTHTIQMYTSIQMYRFTRVFSPCWL